VYCHHWVNEVNVYVKKQGVEPLCQWFKTMIMISEMKVKVLQKCCSHTCMYACMCGVFFLILSIHIMRQFSTCK
jgi:hypothetical protein